MTQGGGNILAACMIASVLTLAPAPTGAQTATMPATAAATAPASAPASGAAPAQLQKTAYLGVAACRLDEDEAKELDLAPGTALRVLYVVPGGPAAAGGLKVGDILLKFNDHSLVNSQQLAVLVKSCKPRQKVSLQIVRRRQQNVFHVQLGEAPDPPQVSSPTVAGPLGPDPSGVSPGDTYTLRDQQFALKLTVVGKDKRLTVKDAKEDKTLFEGPVNTPRQRVALPPGVLPRLVKLEQESKLIPQIPPAPTQPSPRLVIQKITYSDDKCNMVLGVEGPKSLLVKDKAGKVLFNGPVETEPQRQALSPEFMAKLQIMERSYRKMTALTAGSQPAK